MDVTLLPDVDSTSSAAAEARRQGRALPFAIAARRQSQGRGQRGRDWASPEGNLYITMALAAPKDSPGLWPLRAALCTAAWLRAYAGIRATVKWPNDIYVGGRKLAGLLCETGAASGDQPDHVLVGLGLNLQHAPKDLPNGTMAISLADVKPRRWDVEDALASLSRVWPRYWAGLENVHAAWPQWSTGQGQAWWDQDSQGWWQEQALLPDGSLELHCLAGSGRTLTLNSGRNSCSWHGQVNLQAGIVVADCGNTRTKFAGFTADRQTGSLQRRGRILAFPTGAFSDAQRRAMDDWLREWTEVNTGSTAPAKVVYVGGSSGPQQEMLRGILAERGWRLALLPKRSVYLGGSDYEFEQLGLDRVAALEGLLSEQRAKARLVVMAGTAITIDELDDQDRHLGGYILPGVRLGLAALRQGTAHLPELEPVEFRVGTPHTTVSAMQQGLVHSARALVAQRQQDLAAKLNLPSDEVDVVWSGGDANLLADGLGRVVDQLVLQGLAVLARGG